MLAVGEIFASVELESETHYIICMNNLVKFMLYIHIYVYIYITVFEKDITHINNFRYIIHFQLSGGIYSLSHKIRN